MRIIHPAARVGMAPGIVLLLAFCASVCLAAPPTITSITPSALAPGKPVMISITGTGVSGASRLWSDVELKVQPIKTTATLAAFEVTVPDSPAGVIMLRLVSREGASSLFPLIIDPLPSVAEAGDNKTPAGAQPIALNAAIDGACDELTADYYRVNLAGKRRVSIEAIAARAGSRADVVIRVLDPHGRVVAECDDDPVIAPDARLGFVAPGDGDYVIEVRDALYEGGGDYRYRLRVGDFELPHAPVGLRGTRRINPLDAASPLKHGVGDGLFEKPGDIDLYAIDATAGERIGFHAGARSAGYAGDVRLSVRDAAGKTIARSKADDTDDVILSHKFTAAGRYVLAVEELNGLGGAGFGYRLTTGPPLPPFVLTTETDLINAKPGGDISVTVTTSRADFKAEITLTAQLDGVDLPDTAKIPADKPSATLKFKLPQSVKPGEFAKLVINGHPTADKGAVTTSRITPALRKVFPKLLHPPIELDAPILVYIVPD